MGAPNFKNQTDFPMYVADTELFIKAMGGDDEDVENAYEGFCDYYWEDFNYWIDDELADFNDSLMFHEVKVLPGYYDGFQFYVEDNFNDGYDYSDEECWEEFDMCHAVARSQYDAEHDGIVSWLEKNAPMWGCVQIVCRGVFSNGEAVYEQVAA